jgi:hypothetical protein
MRIRDPLAFRPFVAEGLAFQNIDRFSYETVYLSSQFLTNYAAGFQGPFRNETHVPLSFARLLSFLLPPAARWPVPPDRR